MKRAILPAVVLFIGYGTASAELNALHVKAADVRSIQADIPAPRQSYHDGLDPVAVSGDNAINLHYALAFAGSYINCGAGKCGTSASSITCFYNTGENKDYRCVMYAPDSGGNIILTATDKQKAEQLFNAVAAVVGSKCSKDGFCTAQAREAVCFGASGSFNCTVTPSPY